MQAIICKLTQAGVFASLPRSALQAGSAHAAIGLLEQCHARLMAEPDVFGYDPQTDYTVIVQTWDRAHENVRSLAYGRHSQQQNLPRLIPDPYFLLSGGYEKLRVHAAGSEAVSWSARRNEVAWRGSVTFSGPVTAPSDIPRIRLAEICHGIANTDVAIFNVHDTMQGVFAISELGAYVKQAQLWGHKWPVRNFGNYRFTIDIDGHANAWGLLEKLILGCCVLKVSSPYEQWYYDQLQPWKHYVPLRADLADLEKTIGWCMDNQEQCAWIAQNGANLARAITAASVVSRSCFVLMEAASLENPS